MILKRFLQILAVATTMGQIGVASAAVTTYSNRASWTTANGTPGFNVDFESFAVDSSFASVPLDVGPFSLSTVGPSTTDLVDVFPFLNPPQPASFGNAHAEIFVQNPTAADLVFDTPVGGFFADYYAAGNGQQLKLTLSFAGGGSADVLVPGFGTAIVETFGFISTDLVSSIRFSNDANDGFSIDNLAGGVVPEPTSLSLLLIGFGLAGLRCFRRN